MIVIVGAAIGFALGLANRRWWWVLLLQIAVLVIVLVVDDLPSLPRWSDLINFVGFRLFLLEIPALMAWALGNVLFLGIRRMMRRADAS